MASNFLPGRRLQDGDALNAALASPQWQVKSGITALAGGARSASTPALIPGINVVATVATAGDSVILPSAVIGTIVYMLNNDAADAVLVYGNGTDTINGTAGATGVSYAAAKRVMFIAIANGTWIANVMAAS